MSTIAHISDLHLQSGVPERQSQVEPIFNKVNELDPYLIVVSGDVTDDGWDSIDELRWAKKWIEQRLGKKVLFQPGNHDVGNFANLLEGPINDQRVRQWRSVFNPLPVNFGVQDPWAIIGINSMLLGAELVSEETHMDRLERELKVIEKGLPHIAAFMHSPMFVSQPGESTDPETDYWLGPYEPRLRLYERLKQAGVKLIGSGHVHQTRLTEVDGVKIVWAPPASGTWVHAPGLPNPPMPEQTGFFLHTLHDDGRVDSELIACAPMLKLYEHNP
ncbi:MAG: metallophosphoesterase [Planctomycetota bacterium]